MRILTIIGLLICITGICCQSLTSESIDEKDDSITRPFKERVFDALANLKKNFYKAVMSPEGSRAPNICVWKICSKPLKKYRHEKSNPITLDPTILDEQRMNAILKASDFLNLIFRSKYSQTSKSSLQSIEQRLNDLLQAKIYMNQFWSVIFQECDIKQKN